MSAFRKDTYLKLLEGNFRPAGDFANRLLVHEISQCRDASLPEVYMDLRLTLKATRGGELRIRHARIALSKVSHFFDSDLTTSKVLKDLIG